MKIIAVANQKGGSGKTTVAMLLADALHRRGLEGLVVDTDRQGSSWKWETRAGRHYPRFPVRVERACDMSREAFVKWLEPRMKRPSDPDQPLDFLVIDTPPGLDSPELYTALYICDRAVVPIKPQVQFVDALEEFVQLVGRVSAARTRKGRGPVDCRAVLNLYSGRRASERVLIERASQLLPWPLLQAGLKDLAAFADVSNFRTSLYALPGARAARDSLEALVEELAL